MLMHSVSLFQPQGKSEGVGGAGLIRFAKYVCSFLYIFCLCHVFDLALHSYIAHTCDMQYHREVFQL